MKIQQEIYLKEEGFSPEKCIAELESPVSSKFVSVRINGERNEYFNLRKTSLAEIVDIMLLRTQSGKVLEEMKSIITRLEKETSTKNEKMAKETTKSITMKELTTEFIKSLDIFGRNPSPVEYQDCFTNEKTVYDNWLVCENKELGVRVEFVLSFGYWKLTVTESKKSYDNVLSQTVKVKYQEEAELFLKMISLKYQ